jgi:hypothetical protein
MAIPKTLLKKGWETRELKEGKQMQINGEEMPQKKSTQLDLN